MEGQLTCNVLPRDSGPIMANALRGREVDELGWNRPDYF